MENLVYVIPVVIGAIIGFSLSNKFGARGSLFSKDSSDDIEDLNTRDRLKYGFILVDNMDRDRKERVERVKNREKKDY